MRLKLRQALYELQRDHSKELAAFLDLKSYEEVRQALLGFIKDHLDHLFQDDGVEIYSVGISWWNLLDSYDRL